MRAVYRSNSATVPGHRPRFSRQTEVLCSHYWRNFSPHLRWILSPAKPGKRKIEREEPGHRKFEAHGGRWEGGRKGPFRRPPGGPRTGEPLVSTPAA